MALQREDFESAGGSDGESKRQRGVTRYERNKILGGLDRQAIEARTSGVKFT